MASMRAHDLHDATRSALRAVVVSRLVLALLVLIAGLVAGGHQVTFYLVTGLFFLITTLSLARMARRSGVPRTPWLSIGQMGADLVVITGLAAFTEAGAGLVVFLYLVPIISASILYRPSGGLLAAGLSGAAYASVMVVAYIALPVRDRPYGSTSCISSAAMTLLVFLAVGMLVRQLVERLHHHDREMHRLRSLHHTILDNMNSGLVTTDAQNRIIYANPAARAILGRMGDTVVGQHIGTLFARRTAEGTLVPFDPPPTRITGERRDDAELVGLREGHAEVAIGYNISLIPSEESHGHAGKIMLFQDLTEVKRLEQRARQTDRLRAVGELAASIAHEIRNPLASIAGSIELLADSPSFDEREQKLLRIIMQESDRLNHIIEQFLAYTRERTPELAPRNIRTVLDEVLTLFQNSGPADDRIRLELQTPDEPLAVLADEEQLRQVFFNLLRNATEAMPDGGTIHMEVVPPSPGGSEVCLRITDTGCGVAPNVLEQIFEPFFSTKRRGTGLGLALAEKIIRAHHGTIAVESRPGHGTIFTITLPQPDLEPARAAAPAEEIA